MKKVNELRSEFLKTMVQLATAGFGLAAALAWNEAIQGLINKFLPEGSGLRSQFLYAMTITAIAVLTTYFLGKAAQRATAEEEESKPNN